MRIGSFIGAAGAILAAMGAVSAQEQQEAEKGEAKSALPKPLTLNNFMKTLETELHFVEFFSPYCSHCVHFAPTWEATWESFHDLGKELGIHMHQVDCVESGDLCNDQQISSFPSLRLYGPKGELIMHYPGYLKRTKEDIVNYLKDMAFEYGENTLNIKSKSELVNTSKMVSMLSAESNEPMLVSFWPSYDLEDIDELNIKKFHTSYDDESVQFQRTWSIVSNHLADTMKTGHFNCLSNKKICKTMNIPLDKPSVGIILNQMHGKFIPYESIGATKEIVSFAKRTLHNSQFLDISTLELAENEYVSARIEERPNLNGNTKNIFVFFYDEHSTLEDFDILPYLVEPLSKLPDAYLFKSNDTKIFDLLKLQYSSSFEHILGPENVDRERLERQFTIETLSSIPTLISLKDHTLFNSVFHSHGPYNIRDQHAVIKWVNEHATSTLSELTQLNYNQVFNAQDSAEKVMVLLTNLTDSQTEEANEAFGPLLDFKNKFEFKRHYKNVKSLFENRNKKNTQVPKSKFDKLFKKPSKTVEFPENAHKLTTVYCNLRKHADFFNSQGLNVNGEKYKHGDIVIVDKKGPNYYSQDSNGEQLTLQSEDLVGIVSKIMGIDELGENEIIPKTFKYGKMSSILPIHSKKGYLFTLLALGIILSFVFHFNIKKSPLKLFRSNQSSKMSLGILGSPDPHFEKKD